MLMTKTLKSGGYDELHLIMKPILYPLVFLKEIFLIRSASLHLVNLLVNGVKAVA